ncbi:MAG: prenyltransferase/squalene oxidase repeat-containing protein [Chthoniobacteraceae bacterium]
MSAHTKNSNFKIEKSYFLSVSVLIHVGIVLLFGGTVLFKKYVETPNFVADSGGFETTTVEDKAPPQNAAPSMPTLAPSMPTMPTMSAITTINPTAPSFSVPVAAVAAPNMSNALEQKMSSTTSSMQKGLSGLPASMGNRSASRRAVALSENKGKPASDAAVVNALRWLQKNQNPDGTWGKTFPGAMTGLALLCFLGHGETPAVSQEFGVTVNNAINAIVAEGTKTQGKLIFHGTAFTQSSVYEHGIATYAASEAYTMTKDERLAPIVKQAIGYILDGQATDGGWMYSYSKVTPSDTSVTGWQIQALKAAHLTGLPIDGIPAALDNAMKDLDRVFEPKNGTFGYRVAGDHATTTGIGVLCKIQWQGKADHMAIEGLKSILNQTPVKYHGPTASLYTWYYNTQACFMAGGSSWDKWNRMFQDELVGAQSPDGSWPVNEGKEPGGLSGVDTIDGQVYRTALCSLMLEVYYRFLPSGKE